MHRPRSPHRCQPAARERAAAGLSDSLLQLVGLAFEPPEASARSALQRRARGFVEANLADPELAPATAARALGVSLRTVHKLFAERGETFGRFVLQRRLQRCREALEGPVPCDTQ
jgi:AraC family transcriptional activator of tynA and feaB